MNKIGIVEDHARVCQAGEKRQWIITGTKQMQVGTQSRGPNIDRKRLGSGDEKVIMT